MWKALWNRRPPDVPLSYAWKFAIHYHFHKLVSAMAKEGPLVNTF